MGRYIAQFTQLLSRVKLDRIFNIILKLALKAVDIYKYSISIYITIKEMSSGKIRRYTVIFIILVFIVIGIYVYVDRGIITSICERGNQDTRSAFWYTYIIYTWNLVKYPILMSTIYIIYTIYYMWYTVIRDSEHSRNHNNNKTNKESQDNTTKGHMYNINKYNSIFIRFPYSEGIEIKDMVYIDVAYGGRTERSFQMPEYLREAIVYSYKDKLMYFRSSHPRGDNLPYYRLYSLEKETLSNTSKYVLKLGSVNYVDIWYYNYAFTPLATKKYNLTTAEEKVPPISIADTCTNLANDYYRVAISEPATGQGSHRSTHCGIDIVNMEHIIEEKLVLFDALPNPLGVTGVIEFLIGDKYYYLVKHRGALETDSGQLQMAYAGLVSNLYPDQEDWLKEESYKIINNRGINDRGILIKSYPVEYYGISIIMHELIPTLKKRATRRDQKTQKEVSTTELLSLIYGIRDTSTNIKVKAAGIILNADKAFQPELIIIHSVINLRALLEKLGITHNIDRIEEERSENRKEANYKWKKEIENIFNGMELMTREELEKNIGECRNICKCLIAAGIIRKTNEHSE